MRLSEAEILSVVAQWSAIFIALVLAVAALRKRRPKLDIRWHVSYADFGVQLTNLGDIPASLDIRFEGLDEIRNSEKNYQMWLPEGKEQFKRVVLGGEQVVISISNPFQVGRWMQDETIPALKVVVDVAFVSVFGWVNWKRKVVKELKWGDRFHELLPAQDPLEKLAENLEKLWKGSLKQERTTRDIQRSVCRHAFDREDRRSRHGRDEDLLCDTCGRFFAKDGVVVRGWMAERARLGLPEVDLEGGN